MPSSGNKPISSLQIVIDLVACAAFFVFFFLALQPHVPSEDPAMIRLWGALASACMTGVFWMAMHMVRVVYRFQRDSRR
jgi:hypothetical protein